MMAMMMPVMLADRRPTCCGDGQRQGQEECDDGDVRDDNGCTIRCAGSLW